MLPKLYIVSDNESPVYVGITRQRLRTRLKMGFKHDPRTGYHGYAWRHHLERADIDVWVQESDSSDMVNIETVEAEIVLLFRQIYGQWPKFQTEIHFHPSNESHRRAALGILASFQANSVNRTPHIS